MDQEPLALGRVLDEDRGSLPFSLIHGEALVAAASWALSEAGVLPVDARTSVEGLADAELPLVLHDCLCPMTPPAFIAACVRRAVDADLPVAAVLPATDTVGGLAPDARARVVSPVVLPASRVATVTADAATDLTELVAGLRADDEVVLIEAPPEAMRVSGPEDLEVLEALTRRD